MGHGCYRIFRSPASMDFLVTITMAKSKKIEHASRGVQIALRYFVFFAVESLRVFHRPKSIL